MKILDVETEKRRLGSFGERRAILYLLRHGYLVTRRNYVAFGHEVDIIAHKGRTTVFVEVKTRTIGTDTRYERRPASAVTPKKQRSIMHAASAYAAWYARDKKRRFDIIEVYVNTKKRGYKVAEIKHLIGAFNKETAFRSGDFKHGEE